MSNPADRRDQVFERLTQIFRDVFDDPRLVISDLTTAKDVKDWDSLNHINLVVATEQAFKVRFNTTEVARMANVGEFVDAILRKSSPSS